MTSDLKQVDGQAQGERADRSVIEVCRQGGQ